MKRIKMDPIKNHKEILNDVQKFFDKKISQYGATFEAVDYNSKESQEIRFIQLLKVIDTDNPFTIIDYGCGYGELAHFINGLGFEFEYQGFDISEAMIKQAIKKTPKDLGFKFTTNLTEVKPADYAVASGIFNKKLEADNKAWENLAIDTLKNMANLSQRGFSFNMLTSYSDPEFMREDLYYGDPLFYFDYCKKNFSRNVALLHDYELYDFTILVRT